MVFFLRCCCSQKNENEGTSTLPIHVFTFFDASQNPTVQSEFTSDIGKYYVVYTLQRYLCIGPRSWPYRANHKEISGSTKSDLSMSYQHYTLGTYVTCTVSPHTTHSLYYPLSVYTLAANTAYSTSIQRNIRERSHRSKAESRERLAVGLAGSRRVAQMLAT